MEVTVRSAKENDVEQLAGLMGELGYPATKEEMQKRFSKINAALSYHTFVAVVDDSVVGMIGMMESHHYERNDDYIRIVAFVVASAYRNHGVGRKLLEKTESLARKKGIHKLVLNSGNRDERNESHRFYERSGFEGKATGFYKMLDSVDSQNE
ncbi:GNAT family N-acetyltransferase [Oceanobacillus damuensis]|uniref:GNAT family N-acetyltransferase n=1 Tax=Oceanobacillus damuensis TaxID=937928 RepID=UPI000AB0A388|nr:GNAT family N-acetyltransferase [Oceanobacillus damuensis]